MYISNWKPIIPSNVNYRLRYQLQIFQKYKIKQAHVWNHNIIEMTQNTVKVTISNEDTLQDRRM